MAEAARLRFSERAPSPALAAAVARLWSVEAEAGATVRTLPDGCVDVTVDLGARRAWLTGPREASFTFTHARATRLFGVQLQPGHARAVLGVDVGALGPERRPLGDFVDDAEALAAAVCGARDEDGRVHAMERWLAARLGVAEPRLQRALETLADSDGTARVAELARIAGASPRNLDRLFLRWVGTTPKKLARIVRFQAALARLRAGRAVDWAAVAAELGYADQSHLIRDFAEFSGLSPSALRARL